jgi:hypothetical protein
VRQQVAVELARVGRNRRSRDGFMWAKAKKRELGFARVRGGGPSELGFARRGAVVVASMGSRGAGRRLK